ncbi:MAG: ATP-dependent 6-phosphofructokinase [Actinomycetota bacterium]
MEKRKRIGILTSGGDCPGLNAVIRAAVSHATLTYNWEVLGIPYATQGILDRKSVALNVHGLELHGIDPLLSMGGTILGSINKGNTFDQADEIIAGYYDLGLDALIAIGGEGSLAILYMLAQKGGWKIIGVPKTIDNDVPFTERSVGFDTAVNTITEAMYRLAFTAASHDRVMVVEVMGREVGHLALNAGIAGGADVILIPEIPYSINSVCSTLAELRDKWGRKFAIVVVAEGAKTIDGEFRSYTDALGEVRLRGIGEYIADEIGKCSGAETRVTVLGHVQRGGIPSALDRLVATAFGKAAVDLVAMENYGQMVAWQEAKVCSVPLEQVFANSPRRVDPNGFLLQTARSLGIYIGELGGDSQDGVQQSQPSCCAIAVQQ